MGNEQNHHDWIRFILLFTDTFKKYIQCNVWYIDDDSDEDETEMKDMVGRCIRVLRKTQWKNGVDLGEINQFH